MNPQWIVLHHFVSPNDEDIGVQKRRLKAVLSQNPDPYHYAVFSDGSWWMLHSPTKPIGHCGADNIEFSRNYATNFNSIGICAMGNFQTGKMNATQKNGLINLLAKLCVDLGIDPTKHICRHFDVVGRGVTACPGKFFPYEDVVKQTTSIVKSRIELIISDKTATFGERQIQLDKPPFVLWGRAVVGARDLLEGLAYDIKWNQKEQTITATKVDSIVKLVPGSSAIWVNEQRMIIDEYPVNLWGSVVLPVRSFLECLGYDISWDDTKKKITAMKSL